MKQAQTPQELAQYIEAMGEQDNPDIIEAYAYPAPNSGYETLYFYKDKFGGYATVIERESIYTFDLKEMIKFLESFN